MWVVLSTICLNCLFAGAGWVAWTGLRAIDQASILRTNRRLFCLMSLIFICKFLLAFTFSISQYRLWQGNVLTRLFVTLPVDASVPLSPWFRHLFFLDRVHGYFVFYVWGRFWWPVVVSFIVTILVACSIWAWKRYVARSVSMIEMWFLVCMVAVTGWPSMVVGLVSVVVLALIALAQHSLLRKKTSPTLFWPILISGWWVLLFGARVLVVFGGRGWAP